MRTVGGRHEPARSLNDDSMLSLLIALFPRCSAAVNFARNLPKKAIVINELDER
jgi:hypothetical protein